MNILVSGLSDTNCGSTKSGRKCSLHFGLSSSFCAKSSQRRNGLNHFGFNYLEHTFDFENGRKILKKCDERTEESYPDVITGERKTMIPYPPTFQYSSKLKDFSVFDDDLETRVEEGRYKDEEDLNDIKMFKKIYLPQAGERDIYNPVLGCFSGYPGICINGFEPNQHLKEFSGAAEDMRNEEISTAANAQVQDWMTVIKKKFPGKLSRYIETIHGVKIHDALKEILSENKGTESAVEQARKRFKPKSKYKEEDVKKILYKVLKSGTFYDVLKEIYEFNELEQKMLECLGSTKEKVNEQVNKIVEAITPDNEDTKVQSFNIHQAIESADYGDMNRKSIKRAI